MKNGNILSEPLKSDASAQTRGSAARRDAEFLHMRSDVNSPPARRLRAVRWLVGGLIVLGVVGGLWWYRQGQHASVSALPASSTSTPSLQPKAETPLGKAAEAIAGDENALGGAVGLALQGISLFSGEKGAELWRLKATYANLAREGSNIDVDLPVVRYTMGTPGEPGYEEDFLDVKSDKGRVTDNQRYITLWGNVDVKRYDDTITGPRLNYDSVTRIMVFPEGATMDNPEAWGEAGLFTWDLASNVMTGENGVTVVIKPQPDAPEAAVSPEAAVAPAKPVVPVNFAQPAAKAASPSKVKKQSSQPARSAKSRESR